MSDISRDGPNLKPLMAFNQALLVAEMAMVEKFAGSAGSTEAQMFVFSTNVKNLTYLVGTEFSLVAAARDADYLAKPPAVHATVVTKLHDLGMIEFIDSSFRQGRALRLKSAAEILIIALDRKFNNAAPAVAIKEYDPDSIGFAPRDGVILGNRLN